MKLSANSLFHFTSKKKYLLNILKGSFSPRYCLETFNHIYDGEILELAIPMTCFCDIPLSAMNEHFTKYGEYGIGLTKEWGIRNGLSPILYVNNDSFSQKCIQKTFETSLQHDLVITDLKETFPEFTKDIPNIYEHMYALNLLFLTKPYIGDMPRGEKILKKIEFYNEREWRYLPMEYLLRTNESTVFGKDILQSKGEKVNEIVSEFKLEFTANDIKYIIVSEEKEIADLISEINSIEKFNKTDKTFLISRLISVEQIKSDF